MQASEFLAVVLPPPNHGLYCTAAINTKRKEHFFTSSIEAVVEKAFQFSAEKEDAYFAVATFEKNNDRTASNAKFIKALFIDVDCGHGKPYGSAKLALEAIGDWCTITGFPLPYVVSSGYGLHAYWPFDAPVSVTNWRPLADALKTACHANKLYIDASATADAARVLRIPGTFNYKNNSEKKVLVKLEGDPQPFDFYAALLSKYRSGPQLHKTSVEHIFAEGVLANGIPEYASGASFSLDIKNISQTRFENIKECEQINYYVANAPQEGMEPLWRAVISIAKYSIEGEDKAAELSKLHPYDEQRTQKKLLEIKGPYSCKAFDGLNPGICTSCKHYGNITNPLALGRELKPSEITSTDVVRAGSATVPIDPPTAPKGYAVNDKGVGFISKDENGVAVIVYVADTPFYATATYDRSGERYVQFTYIEHGTAKNIVFPLAVVTSRDESLKAFAKIGVIVPNGQEGSFRAYIKASIAEAKKMPPMWMPVSLGWQPDNSFAYDGRVFTADGERAVPMEGMENVNATIGVKGTLDNWRLVIASIIRMERWDLLSMMMIGFASPLMKFTGLNGVTFHLCGNDSGRGKTLCQRLASSVWGAPDKFRVTPNTSPLAMINRLGLLGNLPLMVDEITHKGRTESEWFPEFLSQMSDGRGKDRMESSSNLERRNTTTWSSIALMTSNKHMLDYLTAERNHGSEGEIRRLIEFTFNKELVLDELTKTLLVDTLPENYGVAGEAYARWLAKNPETAKQVTKSTYEEVFKHFGSTGDERFWVAGCAAILAGVRLIGRGHANIIDLPQGKIAQCLYDAVKAMRLETRRTKRTALDVLNEFTKKFYGKLVMVDLGSKLARLAGAEIAETLDRHDICGRVERGVGFAWIDYYIEERALKSFCSSLSFGYEEFKLGISEQCKVRFCRKDLLSGTKGPCMQMNCIHIEQEINAAALPEIIAANENR